MQLGSRMPIGIYEKALPAELPWEERLEMAASAGYDFVEMSIDESEGRLARLTWTGAERTSLRQAIANTGVPIFTMCLSAHRKFPLGSLSEETRQQGYNLLQQAIELAAEIGAKVIQIMGYDVFYEPSTAETGMRYLEGLYQGARWAATTGVMLALENVDVKFVDSVEKALYFVHQVNSPWFNIYPDMGNLVAAGYDPIEQLCLAKGHLVGVHIKDATPGVVRGVPFGEGIVPFADVFNALAETGFWGPMAIEMWAHMDTRENPLRAAIEARKFVDRYISAAWNA